MKFWAICFALCVSSACSAADQTTRVWTTHTGVELQQSAASRVVPVFDPSLTIEENNRRLSGYDNQSYLLASVTIPRDKINAFKLAGRTVQFTCQGKAYSGQVSSFSIDGDSTAAPVRVFVRVKNEKSSSNWVLNDGHVGTLRVLSR